MRSKPKRSVGPGTHVGLFGQNLLQAAQVVQADLLRLAILDQLDEVFERYFDLFEVDNVVHILFRI